MSIYKFNRKGNGADIDSSYSVIFTAGSLHVTFTNPMQKDKRHSDFRCEHLDVLNMSTTLSSQVSASRESTSIH